MIKTNELRTWNIVKHLYNTIQIESIFGDSVNVSAADMGGGAYIEGIDCKDIEPIPLTAEWLEKFGLVTLDAESDIEVWGLDDSSNGEEFSIITDGFDAPKPTVFYFEYDLGYRDVRKEIKYVHQLQNLYFALTGKELEIKK